MLHPNLNDLEIEMAFFSPDCYPDLAGDFMTTVLRSSRLRWLQTFSAGVDHPIFETLVEGGCQVTTASGASAIPISQAVLLHLLALGRRLPETLDNQRNHRWERLEGRDLAGTTTVVLGFGPIGQTVAVLLGAFGSHVIALRRSVRGDESVETWPIRRLEDALVVADQLVLALPLTSDTRNLIDKRALELVPDHCLLVNVGRGELIEEQALVDSLSTGKLGGAALDVFVEEPLPEGSRFWDLPNTIITPHIAGRVPTTDQNAIEIFFGNLNRYLAGHPLLNQI